MIRFINHFRELWYRFAYDSISLRSLTPDSVEVGTQDLHNAVRWIPTVEIKEKSKQAYFTHPPSQVKYKLKVPPKSFVRAFVALLPEAWEQNKSGVEFGVSVSSCQNGYSVTRKSSTNPAKNQKHRDWTEFKINLYKFANQEVDLLLSATTLPEVPGDYAWAIWGNPVIMNRIFFRKINSFFLSPMRVLQSFYYFCKNIYQSNYMIRSMVIRDIRARYVGSFLGIFWSIIHPLTQLLIYYFLFSVILKVKLGPEYGGTDFAIWLVAGLLLWMFFAEIVSGSPGVVLGQANLITKMVFPSEILPFAQLMAAMFNHLIGIVIFIGFLVISGHSLSLNILLIVPVLFATGLFALGIAWALSALNVFLRDIGQIIGVFVNIWFFLTPIMYPLHLIPESLQKLYNLNPMLHAVEAYRGALLGKTNLELEDLTYLLIVSLVTFAVGGLIFKKLKPAFADVL